ncbi:MAG TPA: hypothetical protein VH092_01225 [Urbifossiella sp.]|nr:hypothetical protein [Urbifossiella sp.]
MRLAAHGLLAALVVLAAGGAADGFGRGGFVRGGAVAGPGGAAFGGARGGVAAGPFGAAAGGARAGTYVGPPRGTTVQAGRAGGVATGPFGGVHAGGAEGVRVTTPGGRSFTDVNRAGAAVGPLGGVRVGEAGRTTVAGPFGEAGTAYRGGVGVGPYGGVAASGVRVGGAVAPYGAVRVGHWTNYVSPNTIRATAAVVRGGYNYAVFTPNWYRAHAAAWVAPRWVAPVWAAPAWPAVSTFVGISAPPVVYDYGSTVVIQDDAVYVGGEPAGSAADYAAQAAALAEVGRTANAADAQDWQPLGVFGMVQGEEKVAQRVFQLGINKAGVVRGNYYDAVADNSLPVYGFVDTKTQRVAWSIGEKKDIVFEAGLTNLTQPEATLLVHYGKDRTDQAVLVRLPESADKK